MDKLKFIETRTANTPEIKVVDKNKEYIYWGENNMLPYELYNLFEKSSIMTAIVGSMRDYILGDEIVNLTGFQTVNRKGDTLDDLVYKCVMDYCLFGGFAIQVIRTKSLEKVAELNWLDMRKVRISKEEDTIWFNEWDSRKRKQPLKLPRFLNGAKQANSVFYYKGRLTRTQYPTPMYVGALTDLQISAEVDNYNMTNILNNFTPSAVINFNNGQNLGEDEIDELEQKIYDKFSGTSNAGKIVLSFNDDTEHATTIERLADDGLENKYNNLMGTTRENIYAGFRINPVLTGLNKTNSGFTGQEFNEAFKLYNKTVIQPAQKEVIDAFEKIFGKGCMEIKPFTIEFDDLSQPNKDTNTPVE